MRNESWKIFWACAVGGGLGALVALQIHHYFWWVGLIAGGLTGYLSYEWRVVLRAIPRAYRAARGFRTPPFFWRPLGWMTLYVTSMTFYAILLLGFLLIPIVMMGNVNIAAVLRVMLLAQAIFTPLFTLLFVPTLLFSKKERTDSMLSEHAANWRKKQMEEFREDFKAIAPHFVLFYLLPRGIWWLIRQSPRAVFAEAVGIALGTIAFVRFLRRFFWQLFLRIHSEMRLLCGIDAMLGAAVGYFAGSAVIGVIAGGSFGLLNYFLVTKAWLEPKGYLPTRSRL